MLVSTLLDVLDTTTITDIEVNGMPCTYMALTINYYDYTITNITITADLVELQKENIELTYDEEDIDALFTTLNVTPELPYGSRHMSIALKLTLKEPT